MKNLLILAMFCIGGLTLTSSNTITETQAQLNSIEQQQLVLAVEVSSRNGVLGYFSDVACARKFISICGCRALISGFVYVDESQVITCN